MRYQSMSDYNWSVSTDFISKFDVLQRFNIKFYAVKYF